MYFLGIFFGVLAALVMKRHACSAARPVPFVMELPNYRLPGAKNVGAAAVG